MRAYFIKRIVLIVPTLLGISLISFLIIQLAPGDPAQLSAGEGTNGLNQAVAQQIIEETRAIYGLDQPLHVQYWRWLTRIVTFDFGYSLRDHRPILDKLKERIPVSIQLSGISLILAYLISIPIGIYSSTHQYSKGERLITVVLFTHYSLPPFWVAGL